MKIDIRDHFEKLLKALEIEQKEEIELHQLLMKNVPMEEKVKAGITLYPVEYRNRAYNDLGELILHFKLHPDQEGSAFNNGKHIELFNIEDEKAEGILVEIGVDEAFVKVQDDEVLEWITDGKIGMNSLVDTRTFELYKQTVTQIIGDHPYTLLNAFYADEIREVKLPDFQHNDLNASQVKVVQHALSSEPISLIHGPPGTGKTTTLVALTEALISEDKKILFCAPANAAVDNFCARLLKKGIKVVRIGNESKVDESVAPAFLERLIQKDRAYKSLIDLKDRAEKIREKAFKFRRNFGKEEYQQRKNLKIELRELQKDIRKIQRDITNHILKNADVIAGTFYSVQTVAQKLQPFDVVMVDEAGQAIEPSIWSVARFGEKLVAAGDELQLPPTIKSRDAEKLGLSVSLLEQAKKIGYPSHLLKVQYRMNAKIMQFSNEQFYEGELSANQSVAKISLSNEEFEPIEFIDTAGCGFEEYKDPERGSISNEGEAQIVKKILERFNLSQEKIGIITPYRAQLKLIRAALGEQAKISNTVDSFQGQERELIIISMVRSNEAGDIGFLKDYRRMNVALTRAQKKLIVIGDSATIGSDEFYNAFLNYVEQHGSYRSAWEFQT